MARRRDKGNGTVYWSEKRQRWVGALTVGYDSRGAQIRRSVSAKTKAEVVEKLRALRNESDRGVDLTRRGATVGEVAAAWLNSGLHGRAQATIDQNRFLIEQHILPLIGRKKLRDLKASDVDHMLAARRSCLSTSTLQRVLSILRRIIKWAEARELVGRNVAMLVVAPTGTGGRPSRAMSLIQARAVLAACDQSPVGAYVTLALLLGLRNEELRALTWAHVDLHGDSLVSPPTPPNVRVWRSVRAGGDTKTRLSRRTVALPFQCVEALIRHRAAMGAAGQDIEEGLVFCTKDGKPLDPANLRRSFRALCRDAGLEPGEWTPREMRHSFVSLMSEAGVSLEAIARVVGHSSTKVTETVYRKQLRPVITEGTEAMEALFDMTGSSDAMSGKESGPG